VPTPEILPLNVRLERLGQQIVRARLFLDLWFYFEEHQSRQTIIETMREYNEFFRFTPHAYLVSYVVYIAGIFERRRDTVCLHALTRDVEAAGKLGSEEIAALDLLLTNAASTASKATILRSNAFAHRSGSMSYDDVFDRAAVTPGELRDLTDVALAVANRLLLACDLQDQRFTESPRKAAEEMMRALAIVR
jgi:hypothetical protein